MGRASFSSESFRYEVKPEYEVKPSFGYQKSMQSQALWEAFLDPVENQGN